MTNNDPLSQIRNNEWLLKAIEYFTTATCVMPIEQTILGEFYGKALIPGFLYNSYQIAQNHYKTNNDEKSRILIAESPLFQALNMLTGEKGKIAKYFTRKGIRVEFKHNASKKDFFATLKDESIQNIVIVGHGNVSAWLAKDGIISYKDVDQYMLGLPKKKGYFIQKTCGFPNMIPLGRSIVTDNEKLLGYTKENDLHAQIINGFKPNMGLEMLI